MLEKEEVQEYWKSLWAQLKEYKQDNLWVETIRAEYCKKATQKSYEIEDKVI